MIKAFYDSTNNAINEITETFNLVNPIRIGVASVKENVDHLISIRNDITIAEINKHLTNNIRREYIDKVTYGHEIKNMNYSDFVNTFSWLLLSHLFSIYEGWVEDIICEGSFGEIGKKLTQSTSISTPTSSVNILGEPNNTFMSSCFFNEYKHGKHYSNVSIQTLLLYYWYFKAIRNAYMHHGKKYTEKSLTAYGALSSVLSTDLHLINKKSIILPPLPRVGDLICNTLDNVIVFSEIILKLIYTIDAELIKSNNSESYLLNKLESKRAEILIYNSKRTIKIDKKIKHCQDIFSMVNIKSSAVIDIVNFLKTNTFL
jgi:hypothetical protein